jgi:hypothetical protein
MTEAEWLTSRDAVAMTDFHRGQMTNRKLRLFAVACCRQLWDCLCVDAVRLAVEVNERYADKLATQQELAKARNAAHGPAHDAWSDCRREGWPTEEVVRRLFFAVFMAQDTQQLRIDRMNRLRTDPLLERTAPYLLLDISGNPFRPVRFNAAWRTDTAVALARAMYESRDFSAMPILADALQDAGCDSNDVLNHCRGDGPHVRGCWVVDLVLGKE